jgi:hypothetical protein
MRLLLLVIACTTSVSPQPDLSSLPDMAPLRITAGATDGTVSLKNADFSINGAGMSKIGAFNLSHGSGTVELGGKSVPAAVYLRQSFGMYSLYQTLAVESDRIWVLWFYCDMATQNLAGVYYEATDGTAVTFEGGTGTCMDANTTSTVAVHFPALDLMMPPLLSGFTMDGPNVKLDGAQPGSVTLGSGPLTVLVFNTVDCRTTCGSPGWTELHALLWDPVMARVCFGIFYLKKNDTTHVELTYSLTLPSLTDPAGNTTLQATWTTP